MNVILGVTGGVAAYRALTLTSLMVKAGHEVQVVFTPNANAFVEKLPFEALTGRRVLDSHFDKQSEPIAHIRLAEWADKIIIAPLTANTMAKLAYGMADNFLTTLALAYDDSLYLAPAMNDQMYANVYVRENVMRLKREGHIILAPSSGILACGHTGQGRLLEPEEIYSLCFEETTKDYFGKNVLITAGPTREPIDPVRYITNHSSGKMGYALAKMAKKRGAKVTLISGPVNLLPPKGVRLISVQTTKEMHEAIKSNFEASDALIMAAAPADFYVANRAEEKIKKDGEGLNLEWGRNPDILKWAGEHKGNKALVGFAAETENLIENAKAKLIKKNIDFIVANNVKAKDAGFGHEVNTVTILSKDKTEPLPTLSKEEVADEILNRLKLVIE